jgi:hypothetical protein
MEGYAIGRQNGWLSTNDIRGLEDLPEVPEEQGGNDYLVNGNMIPIAVAREQKQEGGKDGKGQEGTPNVTADGTANSKRSKR